MRWLQLSCVSREDRSLAHLLSWMLLVQCSAVCNVFRIDVYAGKGLAKRMRQMLVEFTRSYAHNMPFVCWRRCVEVVNAEWFIIMSQVQRDAFPPSKRVEDGYYGCRWPSKARQTEAGEKMRPLTMSMYSH